MELAAAAHSACYALALRLGEHKAVPERLAVDATVTLDEAGGVPAIVSSHLDATRQGTGIDPHGFDAVIGEASDLCPVSPLFAGAKITVDATSSQQAAGRVCGPWRLSDQVPDVRPQTAPPPGTDVADEYRLMAGP